MIAEFYFPLKKEQLLERPSDNRFWIEENTEIENYDERRLKSELENYFEEIDSDPKGILLSKNSSLIFSVLKFFPTVNIDIKIFFTENYTKIFKNYIRALEDHIDNIDQLSQNSWRTGLKIFVFYSEWLIENYLNDLKGKKKEIKKTRRKPVKENKDIGINNIKDTKKKAGTSVSKKKNNNFLDSATKTDLKNDKEKTTYQFNLDNILKIILRIVQLNIKIIFKNKLIDEDFLNSLIKICFDSLEVMNTNKQNFGKDKIFEILQIIVTKYQNIQILLIKLTTKIVNLVYNQESLVNNLSDFVFLAINGGDSNMNKLAVDIIHEMSKTIFEDENQDSQGLRNVGRFLVNLSEKSPKTIYNNISSLISLFNCESYVIRNSLVEVIGNIIILILCKVDDISDVDTRNNYLRTKERFIDILFDRIYDKTSFCRSKVLSTFDKLCENNTISLSNLQRLLGEASKRLKDDKSQVRKKAISLINRIIIIYAAIFKNERFLTIDELDNLIKNTEETIEKFEEKIKRIETNQLKISEKYDNLENNKEQNEKENQDYPQFEKADVDMAEELEKEKLEIKEEISKEMNLIDYFNNYRTVILSVNNIVPLAIQLLGSKNISDVNETVELFVVLHKLRINSSFEGVKKMLTLFIKPDESIKKKLIEAYKEIYFKDDKTLDVQAAYLIDLAIGLNFSEFTCLKEMMRLLIETKAINMNIFKEIWKIFLRNPEIEVNNLKLKNSEEAKQKVLNLAKESRIALQILNISSEADKSILLNNADLYLKFILGLLQKNIIDWLLIKESLIGLQKIFSMKKDNSEVCLLRIAKTIINGYGTEDNNWFIASQELIETIFQILSSPEQFCQYFIFKLSKPLFMDKGQNQEVEKHFSTQNITDKLNINLENNIQEEENKMDIDEEKVEDIGYNSKINLIKIN